MVIPKREGVCLPTSTENSVLQPTWCPSDSSEAAAPGGRLRNGVEGAPPGQPGAVSVLEASRTRESTNAENRKPEPQGGSEQSLFERTCKALSSNA